MILDTFKHYLNAIRGMGYYIKHQAISAVFLFLVQTNFFCDNSKKNCKDPACRGIFLVSVLPNSLRESPIKKYAADIYIMPKLHHSFTSIKLNT